jgi:hypothetical protein
VVVAESQRRLASAVTGTAWLVALLLHASALFLGPGLLLVAGHRTDRRAWEHRAAIAAAGAVWAALWGRSFVTQLGTPVPEFIPLARPASTARVINQLVDGYPALALLLVVPSTVHVLSDSARPDWRPAIAAVAHDRQPGDAVAVEPGYLRAPAWFLLLHAQPRLVTTTPALRGLTVMTDAATFGGRVWTITESRWPGVGAPSCSPAEVVDGYRVSCLEMTSAGEAPMAAGLLISTAT